jgi:hypothetical protein
MPGLAVVAAVTPDNTPHGYNLTFAVPVALFAVVAVALYLLFSRPHHRIPARWGALPARRLAAPDADSARAAAVAGGLAVAVGGGVAESHLEPAGHVYATPDAADPEAEAGPVEAGPVEAGPVDAGPVDAGPVDAGPVDAGPVDAGPVDAGPVDAGLVDAGPVDAGPVGAGLAVADLVDAGAGEAGAGPPDGDGPAPADHSEDGQ